MSVDANQQAEPELLTGAAAIEAMLRDTPASSRPRALNHPEILVQRVIPIVPPEYRPYVLLDSGNFASSDLNDLYQMLIKRNIRLSKLRAGGYPATAIINEINQLQRSYDRLVGNSLLPQEDAVHAWGEPPDPENRLRDGLEMLFHRLTGREPKAVDWCGKARAVPSTLTPRDCVLVPREIYETLRLASDFPVLLTAGNCTDGAFVALRPRLDSGVAFILPRPAYARLGLTDLASECVLHRPLGAAARAEAKKLLEGDPGPICLVPEDNEWTGATELAAFATTLAQTAFNGATVTLESPCGLLLGGMGATDFAGDSDLPKSTPEVREIDEPT